MDWGPQREIAALLLARDEGEIESTNMLKWARNLLTAGLEADHDGDCTNKCHACIRCIADVTMAEAAVILKAARL